MTDLLFILLVLGSKTALLWTPSSPRECFSLLNKEEELLNTKMTAGYASDGCISPPSFHHRWKCWVELNAKFPVVCDWSHISRVLDTWEALLWHLMIPLFMSCTNSILLVLPGGLESKNLPAMQETWVPCLGQEDLLEKGMATYSSILAWRILWTEESGRL